MNEKPTSKCELSWRESALLKLKRDIMAAEEVVSVLMMREHALKMDMSEDEILRVCRIAYGGSTEIRKARI